ncbi:RNA polymerase sigma-70 factor, ECF subfamily [Agromyces sp. CF514]|uniref:RNA polymerase sigma factor n=1 Tax=Agromyces sp. CF514 TaxID=1881031 RepID=UPI0008E6DC1B|nr:sigma-70 family RNA polymerase sigma factor [Agromyces sp. CF514]SFR83493.1 RNA polymerase sigma-70 factor, ECF subfamily [Agromyces sp. CF514]
MDDSGGTDAELLARLASGDQAALAIVFDRHAAAVTRYAWAMAPSRMDVEEIVQDTFVTMWRKAAEITISETSLLPWLLVTCRNLSRNLLRKAARNRADELDENRVEPVASVRDQRDAEAARDDLRWVLDEISRLDPIDRRVCELCLVDGLPYAEAAEQLGLSVGAVKQRVSRSRARLKKAVTFDEV